MTDYLLAREPWAKCSNPDEHAPHWHTIRAGGITAGGGRCDGHPRTRRGSDMETLTEFLLARIAEDERTVDVPDWRCTNSARGEGWGSRGDECPACGAYMFDGTEQATEDAWEMHMADRHSRVLAECEAKQRIVGGMGRTLGDEQPVAEFVLHHLALPYADHPDYREEWRP